MNQRKYITNYEPYPSFNLEGLVSAAGFTFCTAQEIHISWILTSKNSAFDFVHMLVIPVVYNTNCVSCQKWQKGPTVAHAWLGAANKPTVAAARRFVLLVGILQAWEQKKKKKKVGFLKTVTRACLLYFWIFRDSHRKHRCIQTTAALPPVTTSPAPPTRPLLILFCSFNDLVGFLCGRPSPSLRICEQPALSIRTSEATRPQLSTDRCFACQLDWALPRSPVQ